MFNDFYHTITQHAIAQIDRKGSKFIAYVYACNTDAEVKNCLQMVKNEHPKATHHCYGYCLGVNRDAYRANDDGEPSGSAGKPIYNAILSANITNVLVVVVRYYGGTMLGVPGLIEAYKTCAKEAISHAGIVQKQIEEIVLLQFGYEAMPMVMKIVKQLKANILVNEVAEQCNLKICLPMKLVDSCTSQLKNIDTIKIQYLGVA